MSRARSLVKQRWRNSNGPTTAYKAANSTFAINLAMRRAGGGTACLANSGRPRALERANPANNTSALTHATASSRTTSAATNLLGQVKVRADS